MKRRTVIAAAWAVPAVAVAAAVPARAASGEPTISIDEIILMEFGWARLQFTVGNVPADAEYRVTVGWSPAGGSTIGPSWQPLTGPQSSGFIINGLVPGTEYVISLYAQIPGFVPIDVSRSFTP